MLVLASTSFHANAFSAVAFSQSANRVGASMDAPSEQQAREAAIGNCKQNGGGSDCQVFKLSAETGWAAVFMTCGQTCGVTAVTGRQSEKLAQADAKRDCESYYKNPCQLISKWQESIGGGKVETQSIEAQSEKSENNRGQRPITPATQQRESTYNNKPGHAEIVLSGEKYSLLVKKPPFTTGPLGFANSREETVNRGKNDVFVDSSTRFIARFPNYGSGVSYFVKIRDSVKANGVVVSSGDDLAKEMIESSGFEFSNAQKLDVTQPAIPGAKAVGYSARGVPYGDVMHGMKAVYVYSVTLPEKRTAYALMASVLTPIDNDILKKSNYNLDPKEIPAAYDVAFSDIARVMDGQKDKNKIFQVSEQGIAEAVVYGKGVEYWRKKFKDSVIHQKAGAVACQYNSFPEKRKITAALPLLVCKMYLSYKDESDDVKVKFSEAEEYIQLVDPKQNLTRSQEALDFLSGSEKTQMKNDLLQSVELAGAAMKWLMKNIELSQN